MERINIYQGSTLIAWYEDTPKAAWRIVSTMVRTYAHDLGYSGTLHWGRTCTNQGQGRVWLGLGPFYAVQAPKE